MGAEVGIWSNVGEADSVTTTPLVVELSELFKDVTGVILGVSDEGRPILTGWPVARGLITSAIMSIITSARTPYIISFLSITEHYGVSFVNKYPFSGAAEIQFHPTVREIF